MKRTLIFALFALFAVRASDIPDAWFSALAQVETRASDHARGRAHEVSRYQILPRLWRAQAGGDPTNPTEARRVANQLWRRELDRFTRATGQRPRAEDGYALWHRPSAYRRAGYSLSRMPARIQARCRAFAGRIAERQNDGTTEQRMDRTTERQSRRTAAPPQFRPSAIPPSP